MKAAPVSTIVNCINSQIAKSHGVFRPTLSLDYLRRSLFALIKIILMTPDDSKI